MRTSALIRTATVTALSLVVVASLLPSRAMAQRGEAVINSTSAGHLGILQLRCDCTLMLDHEERFRSFRFRSDPVILRIQAGSPADGRLANGDVITHVDGASIRTPAGGDRFANIQPGDTVALTIQRLGNSSVVRLAAAALDWGSPMVLGSGTPEVAYTIRTGSGAARAPGAAWNPPQVPAVPGEPRTPAPARAADPAPTAPPAPAATPATPAPAPRGWGVVTSSGVVPFSPASPSGWFGFSLRCSGCGWAVSGTNTSPVWESVDSSPELVLVSPNGPADRAGLRSGDVLTHIDGISIATPEGGRRLGAVKPGQRISLTVARDGRSISRTLILGTRPEEIVVATTPRSRAIPSRPAGEVVAASPRASSTGAARELRFNGRIEDVHVEVWSPVASRVERVGDTMIITIGSSIIRLKVDPRD